ncbi:MAG TPA: hypothetical protein EYN91_20675 [Candidatus Melainabacteria bacterium]|nr:hypothetical protein [Candidatus Melainabacteria bacterium]HIN64911.1 hypothetical protein [Candidatus Obscuribacterales bacterium]
MNEQPKSGSDTLSNTSSIALKNVYSKVRNTTRLLIEQSLFPDLNRQLKETLDANESLKEEVSTLKRQHEKWRMELALNRLTTKNEHLQYSKEEPRFLFLKSFLAEADAPLPIFLHIPKTAGTSFGQMVAANVGRENLLELYDKPRPSQDELKRILQERERDLSMIIGHIPFSYGVHRHVKRPVLLITLLREPLDRLLSLYFYLQRQAHAQEMGREIIERRLDIVEFIKLTKERHLDNGHVRFLCSTDIRGLPCSAESLEEAKDNLANRIGLVALTENYEMLVKTMEYAFGWKRAAEERYNASTDRMKVQEMDSATASILREVNQYDCELFEFAKNLVASRILPHQVQH